MLIKQLCLHLYMFNQHTHKMDAVYITYLSKNNNFRETRKCFGDWEEAMYWGKDNLSNFNEDMIKYV